MSNSPLAFLTLLEDCVRSLAPGAVSTTGWRFQRIIDFRGRGAVLQLWDDALGPDAAKLLGRVEVKELRDERAAPYFTGTIHAAASEPMQSFAFAPIGTEETEKQAHRVAEQWKRALRLPE